jgi:hypothetical protein
VPFNDGRVALIGNAVSDSAGMVTLQINRTVAGLSARIIGTVKSSMVQAKCIGTGINNSVRILQKIHPENAIIT